MALYELAFQLRTTVSVIRNEISHRELQGWYEYLYRRPPGWQEDQRTAMIVNALGAKKRPAELFPSLAQMERAQAEARTQLSVAQKFMMKFGHNFKQLQVET